MVYAIAGLALVFVLLVLLMLALGLRPKRGSRKLGHRRVSNQSRNSSSSSL